MAIDFAAATPGTYDQSAGSGGTYGDGGQANVVESLAPYDFTCGDRVVFLTEIEVTGSVSNATLEAKWEFDKSMVNGSDAGHWQVVDVVVPNPGDTPTDIDMPIAHNLIASAGPQNYTGVVTVSGDITGLDKSDKVVVRIVTTLVCGENIQGNSVIQARWKGVTGDQTIPMKTPNRPPPPKPPVEKTAYTKWQQKIDWKIYKSVLAKNGTYVDEQTWEIFKGDSVWANYRINVRKQVENKYSVHGEIKIPLGPFKNGVSEGPIRFKDVIHLEDGTKIDATDSIRCNDGPAPQTVVYEDTLVCEYWVYLDKPQHGVNKVYVWIGDYQEPMKAEAKFWFDDKPNEVDGYHKVYVKDAMDPEAPRGPIYKSDSFYYDKHFSCENRGKNTNTAELVVPKKGDNGDTSFVDGGYHVLGSDSAVVGIHCYGLDVKKTAKTKYDRTYKWKLDKYASHEQIVLANKKGGSKKDSQHLSRFAKEANVKYGIKVESYPENHNFRAWGKIEITNEHPKRPAHIVNVKDVIDPGDIYAEVWCNGGKKGGKLGIPAYIKPGETLTCYWKSPLPDKAERKNVAKVELQNYHYRVAQKDNPGWYIEKTAEGTTWFRGYAPIKFGKPDKVIDRKVRVYDSRAPKGLLGEVTYKETPKRFEYEVLVRPGGLAPECGKGSLYNQAALVTSDTKTRIADEVSIPILVKCFVPTNDPPKKDDPKKDDPPKKGDDGKKDPPKKDSGGKTPPPADDKKDPSPVDDKKGDHVPKSDSIDYGSCVEGKGEPWDRIGPDGKKTEFFESEMTYKQVMTKGKRGKNPHYRLARAYIDAKLYIVGGADYGKNVDRAMRWTERYFASHGPTDANVKRALNATKAKQLRKTITKKHRVLVKYGKHAHMPRCDVA